MKQNRPSLQLREKKDFGFHLPRLLVASLASVFAHTAAAQSDQIWLPSGPDNNWDLTALNWDAGVIWTQNNNAIFGDVADTIIPTVPITFNDLTFNADGYIISAGAGSLLLGDDLSSQIAVTNTGHTASIAETIANNGTGPGTLTKAGLGKLILNPTAANTYSGGTVVDQGTLEVTLAGALGTGGLVNNATLNLAATTAGDITYTGMTTTLSGAGEINVSLLTGTSTRLLNGDYSAFTGTWQIGVSAVAGAGKIQMNGADNAAATVNILQNATLYSIAGTHAATLVLNGGDTGEAIGQVRLEGTSVWNGPIKIAGDITTANDGHIGSNGGTATINGQIGEVGGSRTLIKAGPGTLVLTNTSNNYSGPTEIRNGALSASQINNASATGNLGSGGSIGFGATTTGGQLIYTGAGETTNRDINLLGSTGGATLTQSGTAGLLKFTGNINSPVAGRKTLTLQGSTAASGEISSIIPNSTAVGTTLLTTTFAADVTTITLNSVEGIVAGADISGTGIAAGTKVDAVNPANNTVTLSAVTNGPGTAGQQITVTGVVSATLLTKAGTGTWTLSGDNTFTGAIAVNGGRLVAAHVNALGTSDAAHVTTLSAGGVGTLDLATDTSVSPYTVASSSTNPSTILSNRATPGAGINHTLGAPAFGNNIVTFAAGENVTSGTASLTFPAINLAAGAAGTATLNPTTAVVAIESASIASSNFAKTLNLGGTSTGNSITGSISNGLNTLSLAKSGTSTWTLSGQNSFTGGTNVSGGVLKLDYSSQDNSKLSDTTALTLSGGTVELSGGSHAELVVSTSLSAVTRSKVARSSGGAILQMNTVTPGTGAVVDFTANNIATVDNLNTNGILGAWATVTIGGVTDWATNSGGGADGLVTAYTGYEDVTRLGVSAIPNDATKNVRIIDGGTAGNVTLTGSPLNEIHSLKMDAPAGPTIVDPTAPTDVIMIGSQTSGGILQASTAGSITIGAEPNDGILTTGLTANVTPAILNLITDSTTNGMVINSTIADNGTDVISLGKAGPGQLTLNGNNTFTGTVGIGSGSVVLGSPTGMGTGRVVTMAADTLLDLNGNNAILGNLTAPASAHVTDTSASAGITTLALNAASGVVDAKITNGPTRTLGLKITNANGNFRLSNPNNTFSQGLLLTNATRMSPGTVIAGSYGTGPITVGEAATDTTGIFFATANQTFANNVISNTGRGTDRNGTFRLDVSGITFSGTLTANLAHVNFSTNGNGGATVTGKITGPSGLSLSPTVHDLTAARNLTVTLSNLGAPNDYAGDTIINNGALGAKNFTLALGAADQIPNGAAKGNVIINTVAAVTTPTALAAGTGKLNLNGFNETINGLSGNGTVDGVSGTPTLTLGDNNATATFGGTITDAAGALTLTKIGTGNQTLSAANTYAGVTNVNAGTLTIVSTTTSPTFNIASGATLELAPTAALLYPSSATFTGAGKLLKTGAFSIAWGGSIGTFAMGSGSMIDVQQGIFTGGSSANDVWTNNLSDLNVAAGAQFNGVEENIRVDALTGDGTIASGYPHPRYQFFTFGVDGGSGTFDGLLTNGSSAGNFVKEGAGTQTLTGQNTYTGSTRVQAGTLSVSKAYLADAAAVIIDSGAILNLNHTSIDVVGSLTINGTAMANGFYSATTHPASITGSGILQVGTLTPFEVWAFLKGLDGSAGKENGYSDDPDSDGETNLSEFAFDSHPLEANSKAKVFVLAADSDFDANADKELILTVAVRKTAAFAGDPTPASGVDNILYFIEGTTGLDTFTTKVNIVPTTVTTDGTTTVPALSDPANYKYLSFSLDGSDGLPARGFLRAKAESP